MSHKKDSTSKKKRRKLARIRNERFRVSCGRIIYKMAEVLHRPEPFMTQYSEEFKKELVRIEV
jgi:hypothetical protein